MDFWTLVWAIVVGLVIYNVVAFVFVALVALIAGVINGLR